MPVLKAAFDTFLSQKPLLHSLSLSLSLTPLSLLPTARSGPPPPMCVIPLQLLLGCFITTPLLPQKLPTRNIKIYKYR